MRLNVGRHSTSFEETYLTAILAIALVEICLHRLFYMVFHSLEKRHFQLTASATERFTGNAFEGKNINVKSCKQAI